MSLIPIQQARQLFTQSFIGAWKESYPVTNFLRSFFQTKTVPSKYIALEVSRGTKKVAADILRGTESNRNKFGLSTAKAFLPPYYAESFTNEDLALYDQLFGSSNEVVDKELVAAAAQEVTDNYLELRNKIERAYEVQAAQCLQTGKVTTKQLDVIDYKAKSTLIETLSTKWDAATPLIFKSLQTKGDTLRQNGAAAAEFDVIMGASALITFLESDEYKKLYGLTPRIPSDYNLPKLMETSGGVFHNRISAGPYIMNIWSYPASYTNDSGVDTDYIDPKKVIIIAKSAKMFISFAAVPRVLTDNGALQNPQFAQTLENGAYFLNNFVKPEVSSHVFEIKSAGLALPMTVDHFACMQVLA
jgi:hypothetical protein